MREELIKNMESLLNKAQDENRGLTEEESKEFDNLKNKLDSIQVREKKQHDVNEIRKQLASAVEKRADQEVLNGSTREQALSKIGNDIRAWFINGEKRDIPVVLTSAAESMGNAVPELFANTIVEKLYDSLDLVNLFKRIPYTNAGDYTICVEKALGSIGSTAEGTLIGDGHSAEAVGKVTIHPVKIATSRGLTEEQLEDTPINLANFIIGRIQVGLSMELERQILNGAGEGGGSGGTDEFDGILQTSTVAGLTVASVNLSSLADLEISDAKRMIHAMKIAHRKNAVFFMHPSTFAVLDLKEDSQRRPLLQPDVTKSSEALFLGKRVFLSEQMPELGASNKALLLINPDTYLLVDKRRFNIKNSNVNEDKDIQTIKATMRMGGSLIDNEGLIFGVCPAS